MSFQSLRIDQLDLTAGTQSRADQVPESVIREYAALRADGVILPPINVVTDGVHFWPTDGFSRIAAEALLGNATISANVTTGTLEDAKWVSLAANSPHGVARSNADKRRAVELALCHPMAAGMKARDIAKHTGVHHSTVCAIINEQKAAVGIRQEAYPGDVDSGASEQAFRANSGLDEQTAVKTARVLNQKAASPVTSGVADNRAMRMERRRQSGRLAPGKSVEILKRDAFSGLGKCIRRIDDMHSATASPARHKRCLNLTHALWGEIDGFKEGGDEAAEDRF